MPPEFLALPNDMKIIPAIKERALALATASRKGAAPGQKTAAMEAFHHAVWAEPRPDDVICEGDERVRCIHTLRDVR